MHNGSRDDGPIDEVPVASLKGGSLRCPLCLVEITVKPVREHFGARFIPLHHPETYYDSLAVEEECYADGWCPAPQFTHLNRNIHRWLWLADAVARQDTTWRRYIWSALCGRGLTR
jgi:hypothetical protein